MKTSYKPLAYVRDVTGKRILLKPFESVGDIKVTDKQIVVSIHRARSKATRGFGYQVTKRGTTLYVFRKDTRTSCWYLADTISVWWSTDELHTDSRPGRDMEWEEMVTRPDTKPDPIRSFMRARKQ